MVAVRLQQVADLAGVSLATASRVLHGSTRTPRPDAAARVRRAAAELGYVANAQAQALARASTQLVGLVVHDIADPYFSSITRGVQQAARQHGRQVMIASTDRDPDVEHDTVRAFIAHRADAIILAGSRLAAPEGDPGESLTPDLDRYQANGGRVAVIGQALPGASAVVPDNRGGAAALADALVDAGHRRFAVLAGPEPLLAARHRMAGFLATLDRHGSTIADVIHGEFTRDGGYTAVSELIQRLSLSPGASGPLCLFAVNDVMAIGAVAALRDAGLRVPRDVQVAGFDDIPTLRDSVPSLTTVRLPLVELGEHAVALTLSEPGSEVTEIPVRGEVVLRDSTRLDPGD